MPRRCFFPKERSTSVGECHSLIQKISLLYAPPRMWLVVKFFFDAFCFHASCLHRVAYRKTFLLFSELTALVWSVANASKEVPSRDVASSPLLFDSDEG